MRMIPEIGRGMGPASVVSMSSPFSSSSSASDSLQSVGRATEAAAEFSGQNNARAGLGQVRIVDLRETMKRLPEAGKGVFGWYASRYLNGPSKRTAPLIHLALVCGILGYSFEYSHLKHERDHKAGAGHEHQ